MNININVLQDTVFTWKNIMTLTRYNIYMEESSHVERRSGPPNEDHPKKIIQYINNIQN
jgi:hypothetical protein